MQQRFIPKETVRDIEYVYADEYTRGRVESRTWIDAAGKAHWEVGNPEPSMTVYEEDSSVHAEYWHKHGVLHRECGPAYISYGGSPPNKNILLIQYYREGKLHRDHGPAEISYYYGVVTENYYQNGELHREDGPAIIRYDSKENKVCERYFHRGKPHREGGPATLSWDKTSGKLELEEYFYNGSCHSFGDKPGVIRYDPKTGLVTREVWFREGKIHREGNPAEITYKDGVPVEWYWLRNGELHREDGPARVFHTEEFWVNGKKVSNLPKC